MNRFILLLGFAFIFGNYQSQTLYFPPNSGTTWQTMDPADLGWCQEGIDNLYDYLGTTNSKAFIVLKGGKIVLEKYFGTFTQDSLWVWNSAGKTLTALSVGIAQQEGFLNISDTTSDYLGTGWTALTAAQEEKITIRHQLTMTTGLNEASFDCTDPACLTYVADPGTRWAYHNSPYTLLDGVIANATGQTLNAFVTQKIKQPTGMNGFYYPVGYDNVYLSNARSMARFGLLLLAGGTWNGTPVLNDPAYFQQMTHSSQSINPSYGYLTWLNGQSSFMLPGLQAHFPGYTTPAAPADVFAAMGKDGQMVNICPSQNLVVVRMGKQSNANDLVPVLYNDTIWQKINQLGCTNSISENESSQVAVYPNPGKNFVNIQSALPVENIKITDLFGKQFEIELKNNQVNVSLLPKGIYFLHIRTASREEIHKLILE